MNPKMAKQLQELQNENSRLKKLVAAATNEALTVVNSRRERGKEARCRCMDACSVWRTDEGKLPRGLALQTTCMSRHPRQ